MGHGREEKVYNSIIILHSVVGNICDFDSHVSGSNPGGVTQEIVLVVSTTDCESVR